jgi:EAL domain-containing protein (putative c-di-GMP-specific phosphodiesterase class I)
MRSRHEIAFQPIVDLATGVAHEYECLLRPVMPTVQQTTGTVIQAAVDTGRSVELDTYVIERLLALARPFAVAGANGGRPPLRLAVNLTPASLLDERFSAPILADRVRDSGYDPHQLTIECTEQQAVADVGPLKRQVKALRSLGFGVAVDDAGAGYASFSLIAALRPSIIKIDRDIVSGIARDDAKQALVEAFVSFGRRIGARLVAEGIERRADLAVLTALRVDLGQGYLLGRPAERPLPPRRIERLRIDGAREAIARRATRAAEVLAGPD